MQTNDRIGTSIACFLVLVGCSGAGGAADTAQDGMGGPSSAADDPTRGMTTCHAVSATPGRIETSELVSPSPDADTGYAERLKASGSYLYWQWNHQKAIDIMRAPRTGGEAKKVASIEAVMADLVVDPDDKLYVRTIDGVFDVPTSGGELKQLSQVELGGFPGANLIATDADAAYVFEQSGYCNDEFPDPLYAISKRDGLARPLAKLPCPRELALDDRYVYVSANGGAQLVEDNTIILGKYPRATLYRIPKKGGEPEVLAAAPYGLMSLQVTPTHVYGLLEEHSALRTVVRIPIGGGELERLGDVSCVDARQVRVSNGSIYYQTLPGLVRTDLNGTDLSVYGTDDPAFVTERQTEIVVDEGGVLDLSPDGSISRHVLK